MPKPFPKEFRDDVVRVAQGRDPEGTLGQIAEDFGVHVGTEDERMRQARIEDGEQPGVTRAESDEVRELPKRNRLLEQENEVLPRAAAYFAQVHLQGKVLPACDRARRGRDPVTVTCRVFKLSRQPYHGWLTDITEH